MDKMLILKIQKNELTEHVIYKKLAKIVANRDHGKILERISAEELEHYNAFKGLTGLDVIPDKFKISFFVFLSRTLGLNFGLKLLESGEESAQDVYRTLSVTFPKIEAIIRDEEAHEKELITLIDEERLKYASSIVLGLNDALVELTAALAGYTLALQNTRIIGTVGLITGFAAAMSMASSEYLSTKHEDTDKDPVKASIYTGITYIGAVLFLVFPYFIFDRIFIALSCTVVNALFLMLVFTFYIAVAKGLPFRKRFAEMAAISLGIAAASFLVGLVVRKIFGIE